MNNTIEILQQSLLFKTMFVGLLMALLTSLLGTFVTLRRQAFITDGIAHASLAGVAIGLLLGTSPFYVAILVAILMAVMVTFISRKSTLGFDSIIGILYPVLFGFGLLVMQNRIEDHEELEHYLIGAIDTVTWPGIFFAGIFTSVVAGFVIMNYKSLVYTTFDPELAKIRGVKVGYLNYALNILVAVMIIIAARLVGVVLVTALVIIPASSAKLLAGSFKQMIPLSIVFSFVTTTIGILLAHYFELEAGATIVVVSGVAFLLVAGVKVFKRS